VTGLALDVCDAVCDHEEADTEAGIEVAGLAFEGCRQSLECDAVCEQVKSERKYCPALSTGEIVGLMMACLVVVGVVVGVLVCLLVIKHKKAGVAPEQQAGQPKASVHIKQTDVRRIFMLDIASEWRA
jgi:hypothetical protein